MALSLRICCSRVWSAIRSALFPLLSTETPIIRPGIFRLKSSFAATNAACGPPKPIGTPNLCELPTAISAPISPGVGIRARAIKSVATAIRAPDL